jgi:hypothetical protein
MVIGNVHERFDRVKRHGNENDERRNEVDRRGNFNRRPERHVNHNLDDFDDKNDDVFDSLEIEWMMGLAIRGIPKTMDIVMMLMVILILLN